MIIMDMFMDTINMKDTRYSFEKIEWMNKKEKYAATVLRSGCISHPENYYGNGAHNHEYLFFLGWLLSWGFHLYVSL